MSLKKNLKEGFFTSNPLFILLLGICPALAVTNNVNNALGMSMAVLIVLVSSNFIISLIRNHIADQIRIPVFIVVIASLVTAVSMLFEAFFYDLFVSLGIFLPLITANCLILARAETFARKNKVLPSIMDGIINSFSFAFALLLIAFFREGIGTGHIVINSLFDGERVLFSTNMIWDYIGGLFRSSNPTFISDFLSDTLAIRIFIQPAGAFIVLAFLIALFEKINFLSARKEENK